MTNARQFPANSKMAALAICLTTFFLLTYVSMPAHSIRRRPISSRAAPFAAKTHVQLVSGLEAQVENSTDMHLLQRVLVDDYLAWHKKNRHHAKRLVYHLPKGQPGIGDRFSGLMIAYLNAVFSDRVLLLNWTYPFDISDYFESDHDIFYNHAVDAPRKDSIMHCTTCRPHCKSSCARGDLRPMLKDVDTVTFNTSLSTNIDDVLMLVKGYRNQRASKELSQLQRKPQNSRMLYAIILARLLRPTKPFKKFMHHHAKKLMNNRFVSVHVRLGSGVGESGPRFKNVVPWTRVARCLAERAANMTDELGSGDLLLLATDTPEFRDVFREEVRKSRPKLRVVGGDWQTKHVAHMDPNRKEDRQLFQFALLELLLLSKGDGLVSLKSRFADVAARMGGINSHVVLDPVKHCKA